MSETTQTMVACVALVVMCALLMSPCWAPVAILGIYADKGLTVVKVEVVER